MKKVTAIIVAGGRSRRFGSDKVFALLKKKPVIDWSLEAFETHPRINEIILVLPDEEQGRGFKDKYKKIAAVVKGGEKRQDSVFEGFRRIDPRRTDIVLIHDGARPLVTQELIRAVIEEAEDKGAAAPAIPIEDTVKEAAGGTIVRTVDRTQLVRVQTPQGFAFALFKRAIDKARADGFSATDDAALIERLGLNVFTVLGDVRNIKITSPRDIHWAEALLED